MGAGRRGFVGLVAACLAVGLAGCAKEIPGAARPVAGVGPAPSAAPGSGSVAPGPGARIVPMSATASCTAPPGRDAAGTATSYDVALISDGDPSTAWRCPGDGSGVTIRLEFGRPVTVSSIAVIPGYAKTDPADGTDRYQQGRRLSGIKYDLGGRNVDQQLDSAPTNREPQTVAVGGAPVTGLTLAITSSVPGVATNNQAPTENVAISELTITGQ